MPFLQPESNLEGFFFWVSFRDQSGKDGSTNARTGIKADGIMGKLQIHHHDKVKMPGVDIIINTAILLIKSGRLILKAAKFETAITTKRNNKLLFVKQQQ